MSQKKKIVKKGQVYRSLVAAALIANGVFQFIAPVLAQATTAGGEIKNSATATYEDPNNPNTPINTTSNEVVVQVAEVAGVTVTAAGTTPITDTDGDGAADAGDKFYFNYTVTNVGNDPTKFRIPNLATTTGPASVSGNLEFSPDGGTTWTPITTTEIETGSIPVNGTVQVRVPVEVAAGATAGTPITVQLGDTPADDQNQLRDPNGGDVYTVDNPDNTGAATDVAGEVNGNPVNGTREASATQQITVDEALKTYALAKVLKERSAYSNSGTLTDITDDTLTYDLSVEVEQNDPTGNGINPAPLVGTPIGLDGSQQTRILISDAIPAGTDLASVITPPGWKAVYTDTAIAANANDAATQWKTYDTTPPTNLANVTRIGFVNDPTVVTSVNPGQMVTGFKVNLTVEAGAAAPLTVNNIAQLFGSTPDGDNDPNTNNPPVIDESGDNMPSNFTENPTGPATPPAGTDTTGPGGNPDGVPDAPPTVGTGIPNPATDGVDSGNNNTGTGENGEVNQFIIDPTANELVNGPDGDADAIGPTDNNDDFTNKSSLVPPGLAPDAGTTIDPSPVPFTNTVSNGGAAPADISLIPTPLTDPTDLPNGTTVTVSYGSDSAVYTYDQATNTFTSTDPVITVPAVAPGAEVNYGVEVNLPTGTPLSTDLAVPADPTQGYVGGFPVPITSFIDQGTAGLDPTDVQNTTIDRVYTGYLRLDKETRILKGDGPDPLNDDGTFSKGPKTPSKGNIIEYRTTYTNISEAQSGTGNVTLDADKVVIKEDGVGGDTNGGSAAANNWALDTDGDNIIDTSNVVGTAGDSNGSNMMFYSGNPATTVAGDQTGTDANTDVTKYVNEVTNPVAPGTNGEFTFQRKVN
ncbi:MAG: hypothetical protein AAFV71_05315 [Cyanobacteria bacterium J06633_8]